MTSGTRTNVDTTFPSGGSDICLPMRSFADENSCCRDRAIERPHCLVAGSCATAVEQRFSPVASIGSPVVPGLRRVRCPVDHRAGDNMYNQLGRIGIRKHSRTIVLCVRHAVLGSAAFVTAIFACRSLFDDMVAACRVSFADVPVHWLHTDPGLGRYSLRPARF